MHRVPSLKSCLRQAASISGLARPFESMDSNQLAYGFVPRALLVDQHLDIRLRAVKPFLDRKALFIERPGPEIPGKSQKMRITEEWYERLQFPAYKLTRSAFTYFAVQPARR